MAILGCQVETFMAIDLNTDRQQAGERGREYNKSFGMLNFFEDTGNKRRTFRERVVHLPVACYNLLTHGEMYFLFKCLYFRGKGTTQSL
jgi:hypothetical protein